MFEKHYQYIFSSLRMLSQDATQNYNAVIDTNHDTAEYIFEVVCVAVNARLDSKACFTHPCRAAVCITFENVLVFSPHADDEVLGCFSFLSPACLVVYFGIEDRVGIPQARRIEEIKCSAKKSGFEWEALEYEVNRYDARDLISPMEKIIERRRPDTVLIPQPSYNQDHRAVYDAAITAMRPHDKNWLVRNVLVFEQPDSIVWRHGGEREPNFFRAISIADKLHSYALYASQVRGHRSPELVTALARLRGSQSGQEYAEGFTVRRLLAA